jgi:hypothetical protein
MEKNSNHNQKDEPQKPLDHASEEKKPGKQNVSLSDMIGVLKDCGDVDLEQVRMERLKKYNSRIKG